MNGHPFVNVPVTPGGQLTFADGISAAGRYVEMRAEMDVIVLVDFVLSCRVIGRTIEDAMLHVAIGQARRVEHAGCRRDRDRSGHTEWAGTCPAWRVAR